MFRARTNVIAKKETIIAVIANMNIRKRWETILYDMEAFD
jgi:hypothetical protein